MSGQSRGDIRRNRLGIQLRPTDNAPAWWVYGELFAGRFGSYQSFTHFVAAVPCHMFEARIARDRNVNQAGWHVTHLYDVTDRNVDFENWSRAESVRRAVRNIHPCNYFLLPKNEWQRHGGNDAVLAYMSERLAGAYKSIWPEFLQLAEATPRHADRTAGQYRYAFPTVQPTALNTPKVSAAEQTHANVQYSFSRLCFRADVIEPRGMEQKFTVVTLECIFEMSKREFYDTFPNVVASHSYRNGGLYHYPTTPQKALRFKI